MNASSRGSSALETGGAYGSLAGKVAVVTGGARGIGNAIARRLSKAGANVVLNDKSYDGMLQRSIESMGMDQGRSIHVIADVAEPEGASRVRDSAFEAFGRLDVLVNNAALVDVHQAWHDVTLDKWDEVLRVNLRSCFLMTRACESDLKGSGAGRIINIGSITSFLGHPDLVHYSTSKAGVLAFTRSLARELGPAHVTVNTVVPGAIRTEAEVEIFGAELDQDAIVRQQAVKRRGQATDIAGVVAFLASEEASFITGQAIVVDGGWVMW